MGTRLATPPAARPERRRRGAELARERALLAGARGGAGPEGPGRALASLGTAWGPAARRGRAGTAALLLPGIVVLLLGIAAVPGTAALLLPGIAALLLPGTALFARSALQFSRVKRKAVLCEFMKGEQEPTWCSSTSQT